MRGYASSHRLADAVLASVVLTLLAVVSGDRWLRFPQLVDGLGRGVPLALLAASLFGSVVLVVHPHAVLAFERIRLDRSLVPLDVASLATVLAPPALVALLAGPLGVNGDQALVVLRDVAVLVIVTTVTAAVVPSREVAALVPVVYVLAMGLAGSHANGEVRPWAPLLERSTSGGQLVLLVAVAVATGGLVELRLRRRALAGWASARG